MKSLPKKSVTLVSNETLQLVCHLRSVTTFALSQIHVFLAELSIRISLCTFSVTSVEMSYLLAMPLVGKKVMGATNAAVH